MGDPTMMPDDALATSLHKVLCPRKEEHDGRFCSVLNPIIPARAAAEALAFFRERLPTRAEIVKIMGRWDDWHLAHNPAAQIDLERADALLARLVAVVEGKE